MNICYLKFNEMTPTGQTEIAEAISTASKTQEAQGHRIAGISPEGVFSKHLGWLAMLDQTQFGGYVGASQPIEHASKEYSQVGTMLVSPGFIGQGIGFRLLHLLSNELAEAGRVPFAFCNDASLSIFKRVGYESAGAHEIPPSVQSKFDSPALVLRQTVS